MQTCRLPADALAHPRFDCQEEEQEEEEQAYERYIREEMGNRHDNTGSAWMVTGASQSEQESQSSHIIEYVTRFLLRNFLMYLRAI